MGRCRICRCRVGRCRMGCRIGRWRVVLCRGWRRGCWLGGGGVVVGSVVAGWVGVGSVWHVSGVGGSLREGVSRVSVRGGPVWGVSCGLLGFGGVGGVGGVSLAGVPVSGGPSLGVPGGGG